ncbi:hypothetical protein I4641_21505 [Waterburya agarophytonicola K14]|uniref:Uncharacterized protein n=1 Tax=Waterburya agarophytonicola KI4 TaxID=2874699 RepID=A0A964C0P2_9CYAN|nr:hypothetical protein [Waterburya agarophytonicola]MCC0179540.1 hypothetical protein [Waterburya agarophytonicola KI4]
MSLFLSRYSKLIHSASTITSLALIGNLFWLNSARAFDITFSNSGFESSLTDWGTIGDVNTIGSDLVQASNGDTGFINPLGGINQAIVTTGYQTINRIDDVDGSNSTLSFNQSTTTNPVDSDTITANNSVNDFQTQLGLNLYDLSIPRINGDTSTPRTSKEASAIYQDLTFTVTQSEVDAGNNAFEVSFNWAYLTNDGVSGDLGNQDYSFISIYDVTGGTDSTAKNIELLGDSNQSIIAPTASNNYSYGDTTYYDLSNPYTTSVTGLAAGDYTYRVSLGVVDVDNFGRSSALLIDNFSAKQVPFDFSPSAGLLVVAGIFGFKKILQKNDNNGNQVKE